MSDDGRCVDKFKKRIGIAKTTFSKMKDVSKSTKIPLNTRKRILQCYVWSTLVSAPYNKVMKTRIEALELWACRRMMKIWTEKVTNKGVLSRMKTKKRLLPSFKSSSRASLVQCTCWPRQGSVCDTLCSWVCAYCAFTSSMHPENVATGRASELFNDTCLTHFRNILKGSKKQNSFDRFFLETVLLM